MKFRSSVLIVALLGIFTYQYFGSGPTFDKKESLILHGLMQFIKQVHYEPKPIDDTFSKAVFEEYISRIDPSKRYLTKEDIKSLKSFETQIDDQVKVRTLEFFDESYKILEKRLGQTREYYTEIIEEDFEFSKKEFIELDEEKKDFAKNDQELKAYWRKFLKYEILTRYTRKIEEREEEEVKKTDDELISESREAVKESFANWFKRLDRINRTDRFETYLSAISNYFDPHTEFFNPKEKTSFDISMSGKLEGIGARLQQDGDYVKVTSIVAGGPAWKGKELEVEDQIRAVTQKGEEPWNITGLRLDDVVSKIRGKKGTTVILTVKKKDGEIVNINIERDEILLEEGKAKATIIDVESEIGNIGYIHLPRFYSSFERNGGTSCAKDVADLIERLKEEEVNGIVLDLRGNGGGSLTDVVTMSGLFIEEGPIVQVKSKEASPYLHYDKDEEVQYSGPLIVMVNHFSASASEILAAAMQDYERAIIVGSTTYGKGTVQRFFDLDRALKGNDQFKPLGQLKLTMQKFFRVNGGSTQHKGVIPDIVFPDNYQYMDIGEKEYDTALKYTEIEAQDIHQNVVKIDHLDKIKKNSEARMKDNEIFHMVELNAKRYKSNSDVSKYPLLLESYQKVLEERNLESDKFDGVFDNEIEALTVRNLTADLKTFEADQVKSDRNEQWLEDLKKDFYLYETMLIMKDMIQQEPSFANISERISMKE